MKQNPVKDTQSIYFVGRWFIILSIVITSALSFTLGFFVGKTFRPTVNNQEFVTPLYDTGNENSSPEDKDETLPQSLEAQEQKQLQESQQPQDNSQNFQEMQEPAKSLKTEKPENSQNRKAGVKEKKNAVPKARKYTVQVGAFVNASDADKLKTSLDEQGFNAYIVLSQTKDHKKIYKVRVGEFDSRKEADMVSLKLKKSQNLKTFVTLK